MTVGTGYALGYYGDQTCIFVYGVLRWFVPHRERPNFSVTVDLIMSNEGTIQGECRNVVKFAPKAEENR